MLYGGRHRVESMRNMPVACIRKILRSLSWMINQDEVLCLSKLEGYDGHDGYKYGPFADVSRVVDPA